MMTFIKYLQCMYCGESVEPQKGKYICDKHEEYSTFDVVYDYEKINSILSPVQLGKKPFDKGMGRYLPLLPVKQINENEISLNTGGTPLYKLNHNGASDAAVYLKDDGCLPSGSLKDRASHIAIMRAKDEGFDTLAVASTGNAAASLACLCARERMKSIVYIPKDAPRAKIIQSEIYGADILLSEGGYEGAYNQCVRDIKLNGWYNRCTGYNPYTTEGKKTAAYEIAEQLNWVSPDYVFVGVGDGSIIGGLHKGFFDLFSLGWIKKLPRLVGVQSRGSAYLYDAHIKNEDINLKSKIESDTCADSISCDLPRDRFKAMRAVKDTNGDFVCVSDHEIKNSMVTLARKEGMFIEPAAAAAYAGFLKYDIEHHDVESTVVILATGTGLKDITTAMAAIDEFD